MDLIKIRNTKIMREHNFLSCSIDKENCRLEVNYKIMLLIIE